MSKLQRTTEPIKEYITTREEILELEKMLAPYSGPWRFELFMIDKGYYIDAEVSEFEYNGEKYNRVNRWRVQGEKRTIDNRETWIVSDAILTAEAQWKALKEYQVKRAYAKLKEAESMDSLYDEPEPVKIDELPF